MVRAIGDVEDHHATEGRCDRVRALSHLRVPELELAAPARLPALVQVEQEVDSPVQIQQWVDVEVGVDSEEAARPQLVQSAPEQVGIAHEAGNPGQLLEELDHRPAVELRDQLTSDRTHAALVGELELLRVALVRIDLPVIAAGPLEFGLTSPGDIEWDEVVNHSMGKRPGGAIAICRFAGFGTQNLGIEIERSRKSGQHGTSMPKKGASTLAAMKILELPACPACGGVELHKFDLGGGKHLQRCASCETVSALEYADPSEVYVDGYLFGEAGDFGLDVRHPLFQAYLAGVARRRIRLIERASGLHQASLLDVGSGTGEVLMAARDRGWRVQGVEPVRTAADMASNRGLEVTVSLLEDSGLPERSYDVVSAFHVLEHVPDSRSFLQTMCRWVRPGGFVVLEVPNWNSSQRRRLGEAWPMLRLEHLVHFTPETLPRTMRAVGLEPVCVRSPAYIGPPQSLGQALDDLVRHGRYRHLVEPLSRVRSVNGRSERYPTRLGWSVLRATEAIYDRAGVGAVVFCVGAAP